jgi:hypothetical protein
MKTEGGSVAGGSDKGTIIRDDSRVGIDAGTEGGIAHAQVPPSQQAMPLAGGCSSAAAASCSGQSLGICAAETSAE